MLIALLGSFHQYFCLDCMDSLQKHVRAHTYAVQD